MLSPSVDETHAQLTQAFNGTLHLDSYSQGAQDLLIGKLEDDPPWLTGVREEVKSLAQAGAAWVRDKPAIWGGALSQFASCASAFGGVAPMQSAGVLTTREQWIEVLETVLQPPLAEAAATTRQSADAFEKHLDAFRSLRPSLEKSIEEGWAELDEEEQEMTVIAAEIAHLQDLVSSLEQAVTATDISAGKSVITTSVTTMFNIVTEAGSVPFLSVAVTEFTVDMAFYDLVASNEEISDALQQIGALQLRASAEAQAAAGTKMVLRVLYGLELSLERIIDALPQLAAMWEAELEKVEEATDAVRAGADPSSFLELRSIPSASASWAEISAFAEAIPALTSTVGQPVVLNPQAPSLTRR